MSETINELVDILDDYKVVPITELATAIDNMYSKRAQAGELADFLKIFPKLVDTLGLSDPLAVEVTLELIRIKNAD